MENLDNKNNQKKYTLITGATGGLGRAFVNECALADNNLILVGTNLDRLNSFREELLSKYEGIEVLVYKCDFTISEDLVGLLKYIESNNLKISRLINNAGYICEGSNKYVSLDTLQKCIMVNNLGTTTLTKGVLDLHNASDRLEIITISSLASNYPLPYMAVYSATKAYIKSYMLSLREEYKGDNVTILTVLPGAIATSDSMKEAINAQGLKGRLSAVAPNKIARIALKKSKKNKAQYIPGWFNKLTNVVSKLAPLSLQIKVAGNMWKKSQKKRGIK